MLALHPTYLASRGDPKQYLDDLRRRMDEIAQQSPELGEHGLWRSTRRYQEPGREEASSEELQRRVGPVDVDDQADIQTRGWGIGLPPLTPRPRCQAEGCQQEMTQANAYLPSSTLICWLP